MVTLDDIKRLSTFTLTLDTIPGLEILVTEDCSTGALMDLHRALDSINDDSSVNAVELTAKFLADECILDWNYLDKATGEPYAMTAENILKLGQRHIYALYQGYWSAMNPDPLVEPMPNKVGNGSGQSGRSKPGRSSRRRPTKS